MKKILIADHHPVTREGISSVLRRAGDFIVVGTLSDGNELLNFLSQNEVDILVLEIDIPNLNSIASIKALKREFPNLKILVLSCHPEEMYALSAIKYGASGYVAKTASVDRITTAINYIDKGGIYLNESLSQSLLNRESDRNVLAQRYKQLSSREMQVLNLIAKGHRNKDISEALSLNEKTVSTYKMRLLKKLDASSVAELITHSRLLQAEGV